MKVRVKFRKNGVMKFIGHLDIMRYFQKAMRRAEIPIAFSKGFSPHMIMSFAQPLGVGLTSDAEYMDIELAAPISSQEALSRLNQVMVEGMEVVSFNEIPDDKHSVGMSIVSRADYLAIPTGELKLSKESAAAFITQDEILILKQTKRSEKEVDIRPMIYDFTVTNQGYFLSLATGSVQNLKPDLVMEAYRRYLGTEEPELTFHRLEIYACVDQQFIPLDQLGKEIVGS